MRVAAKSQSAARGKKREARKGGVKIMFREHVINRRDENKARTLRVSRRGRKGGRVDERINHVGFAPLKSLLYPDKNRKRIQGPTRRPRCVLKARLHVVVVVVVVVRSSSSTGWRLCLTQLHPSPGHRHPRDFTSRRVRGELQTC